MPDDVVAYQKCRDTVRILLKGQVDPTGDVIRAATERAAEFLGATIDVDRLVREMESLFSVWVDRWTALDDSRGHVTWLPSKKAEIPWRFWHRYQMFLEEERVWPPAVVDSVDRLTDAVLERLEDPARPPAWDRRGMVVGSIQSGKTANYIGLICKALDAGYKLVIVLAGMHNSLRSQTQLRIDEGVLGFDTQKSRRFDQDNQKIGVGLVLGEPLYVHSLTNSAEHGDFKRSVADAVGVMIGGDPVILVVKKNKSVLSNLLQWVRAVKGEAGGPDQSRVVHDVPLLLIDDEADNASINTKAVPSAQAGDKPGDYDVTAINGLIREILSTFDKAAYVGYTATPFANIFVNPDCVDQKRGDDIFPRSFIINLAAPSDYVGPARVFGIDGNLDAGVADSEPLPLIRFVDDYQMVFPTGHKRDLRPASLPASLVDAIRAFVLVCAARTARGQTRVHNSMLVHVTRFVDVQAIVSELVRAEVASLRRRIEYRDGNSEHRVRDELREMWERDFVPTTAAMSEPEEPRLTWSDVEPYLVGAVCPIEVKTINGTAGDVLDYYDHPDGRSVIAIGGDKLSRGLTLEGLSVSYFLRQSRMYDTLLQMGRWFGYRPGYLDLCRLCTTEELSDWYRHIALAEQELRKEFDYMVASSRTPADYGLRVRTHPDGLLITAVNKMREGALMRMSFSGQLAETAHFSRDRDTIEGNFATCDSFIGSLGKETEVSGNGNLIWRGVSPERVLHGFLEGYRTHPMSHRAHAGRLSDYIAAQVARGELMEWTVAVIHSSVAKHTHKIGGHDVGLTVRREAAQASEPYSLIKSHILSPSDQYLDFGEEEKRLALDATIRGWEEGRIRGTKKPTQPNGCVVRETRPPERGLLIIYPLDPSDVTNVEAESPIIGFAISFPESENAMAIEYKVNKVHLDMEYDDDGY